MTHPSLQHLRSLIGLAALLAALPAQAELKLAEVFSDHLVLQREQAVPVWGTASPGDAVNVEFAGHTVTATADDEGAWMAKLPALEVSREGRELRVSAGSESLTISDVLVGDVWLCSGQSNMEFPMKNLKNADEEIAAANYPQIRLLLVRRNYSSTPADTINGCTWRVCAPDRVSDFSAVAYFFGRDVWQETDVPIGLIEASWGGTPIEAWTRPALMESKPSYARPLKARTEFVEHEEQVRARMIQEEQDRRKWMADTEKLMNEPPAPGQAWFSADAPLPDAEKVKVPGKWAQNTDGLALYRRVITLPDNYRSGPATLDLGVIDDFDVTWVNGTEVGRTTPSNIRTASEFRSYKVPAGLLKPGANVITVRMGDWRWHAGFLSPAKKMSLVTDSGTSIPLAGEWDFQLDIDLGSRPYAQTNPFKLPGVLYDGMIHPVIPYAIRGAIWYQGEANAGRAVVYGELFPNMINDWRAQWGQGDFPFYFVQLANYRERNKEPVDNEWAELRESQTKTLSLPNTGMAVTIDIGDAGDIHPKNKQEVGRRLALWALADTYGMTKTADGKPLVRSGPLYSSMQKQADKIVITFTETADGLKTSDGREPVGFAIAGADQKFVWAQAKIDGDTVIVSSPEVSDPQAVRYGWSSNPDVNLVNSAGLPASPFRTDDWRAITEGRY
ncbi:MAG: sialate O-acetylesterase [Verrucomicrobiota bacterium JB024]|nr:sialate O-acetylesterase [Verrucomicrobiota bacterium JB024]